MNADLTALRLKYATRRPRSYSVIDVEAEPGHPGLVAALWLDGDGEMARRLVAAWNACEGIDTATLERAADGDNPAAEQVADALAGKILGDAP